MASLRLNATSEGSRHNGEIFSCAFAPDGATLLSAGWDAHLRLWDVGTGAQLTQLPVGKKPLSACTISPKGNHWVAGSMEGLLTIWDSGSQADLGCLALHSRPISSVTYSLDGALLATASWDRNLTIRATEHDRDTKIISGHQDIVSGCRFLADGSGGLLSWSHDGTVRLWDSENGRSVAAFTAHRDRVTAATLSPDGRWAATGARSGELRLWNLDLGEQASEMLLSAEIRGCYFLPDASSLLVVDLDGTLHLFDVPDLDPLAEMALGKPVQCADLSTDGTQLALGCADGLMRFVLVGGVEHRPMVIRMNKTSREIAGGWFRGRRSCTLYEGTCPACRQTVELKEDDKQEEGTCPHCHRKLRYLRRGRVAQQATC